MKGLYIAVSLIFLVGCEAKTEKSTASSGLSIQVGKNGTSVSANDKEGSLKINVGNANLDFHDEKGNGLKMEINDKKGVSIEAKGDEGSFSNHAKITEADLGVPFYPGSDELSIATARASSPDGDVKISTRVTDDAPKQVLEFYKPKLTVTSSVEVENEQERKVEIEGTTPDGQKIHIAAKIDMKESRTSIVIVTEKKK